MPKGAVDADYDDAARSAREQLLDGRPEVTAPISGGLAIDLVTRQLLFVRRVVADDLVAYYEREEFDLLNYGPHAYLPVTIEDSVYECVYVDDLSVQGLEDIGDAKTYDFPRGRLATVPVQEAWIDG